MDIAPQINHHKFTISQHTHHLIEMDKLNVRTMAKDEQVGRPTQRVCQVHRRIKPDGIIRQIMYHLSFGATPRLIYVIRFNENVGTAAAYPVLITTHRTGRPEIFGS